MAERLLRPKEVCRSLALASTLHSGAGYVKAVKTVGYRHRIHGKRSG